MNISKKEGRGGGGMGWGRLGGFAVRMLVFTVTGLCSGKLDSNYNWGSGGGGGRPGPPPLKFHLCPQSY